MLAPGNVSPDEGIGVRSLAKYPEITILGSYVRTAENATNPSPNT